MDQVQNGWFQEINDMWKGFAVSYELEEEKPVVHCEKSDFQEILFVDT